MLEGKLAFNTFESPLDTVDGGIFLGASAVFPVRHRLLRTIVLESEARVVIVTHERFADDPEGMHIDAGLADSALQVRLDALENRLLDFAILTIDRRFRTARYRASPLVSVPVYMIADGAGVSIDWDYSRLLGNRATGIAWDIALAQIAGVPVYGPATIVPGVWRATAGATLIASPKGVTVALPDPILHDGPHAIASGADLEGHLFDAVAGLVSARPLDRTNTAVELSGGMDSALTALAAASVAGRGLMSIGAQFAGAMGEAQARRRRLLCERGGFDDLAIPAERFAAFSPAGLRRVRHGVWPEDENYPEMFEAMFGMLRAAGIDALISGFGGDELYFAYEGEEASAVDAGPAATPFLTPEGAAIARAAARPYPRGWLQQSCWQAAASQSQRVLRYGLWPVYPYHNQALARFVSRLPRAYRRNRQLLRSTLTRTLGDPVFESNYVKESFDAVALRGMTENRGYLADLVRRSPLARHPAIDRAAILAALSGDLAVLDRPTFNALFRLLKIASFFQSEA